MALGTRIYKAASNHCTLTITGKRSRHHISTAAVLPYSTSNSSRTSSISVKLHDAAPPATPSPSPPTATALITTRTLLHLHAPTTNGTRKQQQQRQQLSAVGRKDRS